MQEKLIKNAKIIITVVVVVAFVWFLVIYPMITFHNNEQKLEAAARRYFELNQNELPTGERIKTVTLNTLYHKSYLKKDIYIPYSRKTCSIDNSWVKVRRENNEFKYYVYLECGKLTSNVDHKGPAINLNGEKEETINKGEEYKDPGVKSLVDNKDGRLDKKEVIVKGDVDTSKVGTYEITYTAYDNLNNKTIETRIINVVERIKNTVKTKMDGLDNFIGNPTDNYVRLSNMLFRIYGLDDDDNVILVSNEDVANVNFTKIDKWLDYYYDHLTEDAKKIIVESEYCNMKVDENSLNTTECTSYTKKKKVYIPSIIEINSAEINNKNFMQPPTMSWTANAQDDKNAYLTRSFFFEEYEGREYVPFSQKDYYGIRPMLTIKGSTLIEGGSGTDTDPYVFKKKVLPKEGSPVNERETGEYISINGAIYRIIETAKDGTTRVISDDNVGSADDEIECSASSDSDKVVYNPKKKTSIGYYINNKAINFVDTTYFAKHEIEVPIYKNDIIYGEEIKREKYNVVLSAPDMFEMFAAQPQNSGTVESYWTANISQKKRTVGAIYNIGVPLNQEIPNYMRLKIRVIGYVKKDAVVTSGDGTYLKPYKIK